MGAVSRHGGERRHSPWWRGLVLLGLLVGSSLATAAPAAAADPTFQPASASVVFGEAITLEQRITLPAGVARVEAIVRAGGDGRTFLATIPTPAVGNATLMYRHATPSGALFPNTRVELGFRVTLEDGTFVDGPTTTVRYDDTRFTWQTLTGSVVRVHWYEGDAAFGRRALDIGERAVVAATTLLGVEERDPIDFFIYAGRDEFYDIIGPGLQENVGGLALAGIRTLFANIGPSSVADPWVGVVVPHELTHIVFDTATRNPYHEPPHWLNEGLADYLAVGYEAGARGNVERAARDGELMPLHALVGQFPSTAARFSLAYDESVSAIDYLVRTHGQEALVALIRSYADGVSDDDAFEAALGVDSAGFEAGWLGDLGVAAPAPFGPQPAPPGPLPPGWEAAPVPTPGPGASGPVPTAPPAIPPTETSDFVEPVIIGAIVAILIVLGAGLLVTARGLNRGSPLPTSAGAGAAANDDWDPEPEPSDDSQAPPADDDPRAKGAP
ncbi:MAG TPA: peptidase MA family metallohydrolase [Candidatus Limnocylindria bacterium]|nr:peptidase MA family metallohydrolase [Candidatus Limnocylindria bacterium]